MSSEKADTEVVGFSRADAQELLKSIGVAVSRRPKQPTQTYNVAIMKVTTAITAKSGTTVGKGKAAFYFIDSTDKLKIITGTNETVYNLSTATASTGTEIVCIREDPSSKLIWVYKDCN
jgi:hypothetical protein